MDALKIIADGKADVLAPVCAVLAKRRDGWRAADFYDATLAWQGRKWEEARRLHRKFAEKYAGTPLADYVRQSRLPDIDARRQPGTGRATSHHQVEVGPYDVRRKSVPLYSSTAADAELKVVPKAGYSLVDSYMSMPGAEEALWSGPDPKRPSCHTYRLSNAYSSQEFAFVHGTIKPPTEGRGSLPYFDVAVPAVDIDWFDRPSWDDEDDEDTRIRPVPLVDGISQY